MLKQRIITALLLLPIIFVLMFKTPLVYFTVSIAAVVHLMALEWAKLSGFKSSFKQSLIAVVITLINLTAWYFAGHFVMWPSPSWPQAIVWDFPMIILGLSLLVILGGTVIVLGFSKLPKWWANKLILSVFGAILLPTFFISMVSIRSVSYLADFNRGGELLLLMFFIVWAADTGAYFAGKAFGKHKLAPVVSPNKTWEGALGGFTLSMAIAWIGISLIGLDVSNYWEFSFVIILLAIFSVIGDLLESAMKRVANIKDSGNLLPGHGGLLDRLDSALVVAPLFFLSFSYLGWFR